MLEEDIKLIRKIKIKVCVIIILIIGGFLMPYIDSYSFFGMVPALILYYFFGIELFG